MRWLALGLALAATPAHAEDVLQATVDAGRRIAAQRCSQCHATGPDDRSLLAGAPAFRDLGDRYPVETLAESLAEGIVTGHQQMPVFAFTPIEIDQFLAYLRSVQR